MNSPRKPDLKLLASHPAHFLSFGFGAGLLPKAPGTFGTIAAIPVYLLLVSMTGYLVYAAVTIALLVLGIVVCGITEKALGTHDHGSIVWDEIVGFLITMFLAPATWQAIILGFLFFRLFDILKPFPVSWLDENLHGGFGTMMDDVAAGVMAWASLQVLLFAFPVILGVQV